MVFSINIIMYVCTLMSNFFFFFLIGFIKENIFLILKNLCYYKYNLFCTDKSRTLKIIEKNKIKVTTTRNNILKNTEPVFKKKKTILFCSYYSSMNNFILVYLKLSQNIYYRVFYYYIIF